MRLWAYYAGHTFINGIKKLFRKSFLIILACIIGSSILFGIIGGAAGLGFAIITEQKEAEEEEDVIVEEEGDVEDLKVDSTPKWMSDFTEKTKAACWEAGAELLVLIFVVLGILEGKKDGNSIFLMADVNLLFTAPRKPQSVMMFRMAFQMLGAIGASVVILFQIPNLKFSAGLSNLAILAIVLGWMMTMVLYKVLSIFAYAVAASYRWIKPYVIWIAVAIVIAFLGPVVFIYMTNGQVLSDAIERGFATTWTRFIPFIGWLKGFVAAAVLEDGWMALFYAGLFIVGIAGLVLLVWNMKVDFYEDSLAGAQVRQAAIEKNQEKIKATQKPKKHGMQKNKEIAFRGWGASTFFAKELVIRKRSSFLGFVTPSMLIYLILAILVGPMKLQVNGLGLTILGIILAFVMFIINTQNPLQGENTQNWLLLVPASAFSKVFYAMLGVLSNTILDLLPAMVVLCIFSEEGVVRTLLWYAFLVTITFMVSATNLFLATMLPGASFDKIKEMLRYLFLSLEGCMLLIPFLVGLIACGWELAIGIGIVISIALGCAFGISYPSLLKRGQ